MKFIVYHATYGCDTGCCGHVIEDERGNRQGFDFFHPAKGADFRQWAENLIREHFGEDHVRDLDWENCVVTDRR